MSTPESTSTYRTSGSSSQKSGPATIFTGLIALSLIGIAVALFSLSSQVKYGNCVAAQEAKYPAVGVSAFNTKSTGPIKVAYDAERRKAVEAC